MGWRVLSEFESIFLLIAERLDEGIRLVLIQPAQITHTVRAHVRFGSKADINMHGRKRLLCAKSGHWARRTGSSFRLAGRL
jgi:hypothetical protein